MNKVKEKRPVYDIEYIDTAGGWSVQLFRDGTLIVNGEEKEWPFQSRVWPDEKWIPQRKATFELMMRRLTEGGEL